MSVNRSASPDQVWDVSICLKFFFVVQTSCLFFVDIFNVEIHYLSILLGGTSIVHCGILESENIGVTS